MPGRRLERQTGVWLQWRLTRSRGPDTLVGRWRGTGAFHGGWDLKRVGGPELEPPDFVSLFDDPWRFCRRPRGTDRMAARPGTLR